MNLQNVYLALFAIIAFAAVIALCVHLYRIKQPRIKYKTEIDIFRGEIREAVELFAECLDTARPSRSYANAFVDAGEELGTIFIGAPARHPRFIERMQRYHTPALILSSGDQELIDYYGRRESMREMVNTGQWIDDINKYVLARYHILSPATSQSTYKQLEEIFINEYLIEYNIKPQKA